MFIGHYGPAFASKASLPRIPLWVLFVAVQWMDVVWSALMLLGIEKAKIVHGYMEASPFVLYYMPYTHGIFGSLALSVLFGAIVALFFRKQRVFVFLICAAAVFSHWILDLIVHKPDLWILGDLKVGFGLWRWAWISFPLEIILLWAGARIYARYVPARRGGDRWLWVAVVAMTAVQAYVTFGPDPSSPQDLAVKAPIYYGVLALLAGMIDLTRAAAPTATSPSQDEL